MEYAQIIIDRLRAEGCTPEMQIVGLAAAFDEAMELIKHMLSEDVGVFNEKQLLGFFDNKEY